MYINKRVYQPNHIPIKLNYNTLNKKVLREKKERIILLNKEKTNTEIYNKLLENDIILFEKSKFELTPKESFEKKFKRLEEQPQEFFESMNDDYNIRDVDNFLYHGIRFQNYLEKLESIFKDKAILAGNYQENYYPYSDNCNNGEYISLTTIDSGIVYETFVIENISLVISPKCNAIKTIYLPSEECEKTKKLPTKNRYSYINYEYQVKQIIHMDMIKAIGVPIEFLRTTNHEYLIDMYINDILELMDKYNIQLPIVDTSNYNNILFLPKNYQSNNFFKKNKKLKR